MKNKRFIIGCWGVLVYILGVILWGAYVRATGSGAGCGRHWPLCNGEVIPRSVELATAIEFSHRISSGLSLLLVAALVYFAYKLYQPGSKIRVGATLSGFFLLLEALFGAGLVLLELVAKNSSALRAFVVALHLVNTFLLIASLVFTAWSASKSLSSKVSVVRDRSFWIFLIGAGSFLLLGGSGAIVALGDTLFPVSSFKEGFLQDFSPQAHFLLRLRVIHPALAILSSLYLVCVAIFYRAFSSLGLCILLQITVGTLTMILAAPVTLQMLHLLIADVTWITFLFTAFNSVNFTEAIVRQNNSVNNAHDFELREQN